jgi:hypoxanthine phosphoribosyltransferase
MNIKSTSDMFELLRKKAYLIPDNVDLIVGVPRSGLLPALYLGIIKNIDVTDIDGYISGKTFNRGQTTYKENNIKKIHKKILILDDSCHSGKTINEIKEIIKNTTEINNRDILYGSVYSSSPYNKNIDIYWEQLDPPHIFEWNFFKNQIMYRTYFDMDGVLCRNPSKEEEKDERNYLNFLNNVELLICPLIRFKGVVTGRSITYRKETENWLKKNKISYDELHMYPNKDRKSIDSRKAAVFKSNIYKNSDAELFIESSLLEADIINKCTNKKVINYEIFSEINYGKYIEISFIKKIKSIIFWKVKFFLEINKENLLINCIYKICKKIYNG